MNQSKRKTNPNEPQFSYRNTRSKFYKSNSNDFDPDGQHHPNHSPEMNTGSYWKEQGNVEFKKGNFIKSLEHYTKAIEKSSGQSVFFSNRAKCHKILGNFKEALKDAQAACQLDPDSIKANYLCGCLLSELGKYDKTKLSKAQNRFKKALRLCSSLKKQDFEGQISIRYYRLKKLMFLIDQQQQLEDLLTQIKSIDTKNIPVHQSARILTRIQKRISALQNFTKESQIPDHLCCKITLEFMEEPMVTEEGLTYEKSALEDHFKTNGFIEPISRKKLNSQPYSNVALKIAIEDFLQENPWAYEHGLQQSYLEIRF